MHPLRIDNGPRKTERVEVCTSSTQRFENIGLDVSEIIVSFLAIWRNLEFGKGLPAQEHTPLLDTPLQQQQQLSFLGFH
jgi:hypothetical protein